MTTVIEQTGEDGPAASDGSAPEVRQATPQASPQDGAIRDGDLAETAPEDAELSGAGPADEMPEDGPVAPAADEVEDDPGPALPPGVGLGTALESLLIIAADPMPISDLAAATGVAEPEIAAALAALAEEYRSSGRGFELRELPGGWRFYSAASCADLVARWVTDGRQARLSQAALETLAVIAYKQPVSRSGVGAIRGVNVDAVVRTLQARGLVEQTGEDPLTGAGLYGTTSMFLDRMGLSSVADLPPIVDLLPNPDEVADHIDGEALDLP